MLKRLLSDRIHESKRSVLFLGPRKTGKSTLMKSLKPDLEINLARETEFLSFASSPDELEQRLSARMYHTVLVDEVQRIPRLLNTVQALIDEAKFGGSPLKLYLTGSNARKLRRGQANLMPGRVFRFELGPLVAAEMNYQMETRKALELGTLPEPFLETSRGDAEKSLQSYAATYLREEVQAEALSRNLEGFSRFLVTAAVCSGQFLDFSKLSHRAKMARSSAVRYFELLEDTLVAYRLEPFPDAPDADGVKHPKFYFLIPEC